MGSGGSSGKTLFEASLIDGGKNRDILFTSEGTVEAVEELSPMAALPVVIRAFITVNDPQGIIHPTDKIARGEEVQYEIGLRNGARKEVVLSADGKIVKEE